MAMPSNPHGSSDTTVGSWLREENVSDAGTLLHTASLPQGRFYFVLKQVTCVLWGCEVALNTEHRQAARRGQRHVHAAVNSPEPRVLPRLCPRCFASGFIFVANSSLCFTAGWFAFRCPRHCQGNRFYAVSEIVERGGGAVTAVDGRPLSPSRVLSYYIFKI